ncbi:DNA-binding helix-turn-helix protein [uncultured Eubacteriales bacterium]|uniref:DNA-binding helix-turn-helix protein n=1 Tax=uncultured Eubacteriales bacterium TaxID=172733 RepID=A0A212JKB0_9FIRM|nr:DNA-binding helix-turn-helix protein [uncultured Eubacteriales bacterium]
MNRKPIKKELNIQIGENIKSLREQIGYTQERFSELINVSAQYISDVERGNVGISVATLKKIRDVTRVSSDSILVGKCEFNDIALILEQLKNLDEEYIAPLKIIINKYLEVIALSNQKNGSMEAAIENSDQNME